MRLVELPKRRPQPQPETVHLLIPVMVVEEDA